MSNPPLNRHLKSRQELPIRILQFGEGNFLRAFVDWMIQQMNEKAGFGAGVAVVQPIDRGWVDVLNQQDGLYTVLLTGSEDGKAVQEVSLVDCIQKGINPYTDFEAFLAVAREPHLRFVISNTTEAGIAFGEGDRFEDAPPSSFPAKLTRILYERFQVYQGAPEKGLVIIPCELIDRNGDHLRRIVRQYVDRWGLSAAFRTWVEDYCIFCNTLVDRIVPGFPKDRIEEVTAELGYEDKLVTEGERFHLWVIEGPAGLAQEFPAERAGLNVLFTDDMEPYRTRKVRILNGAHTSMVPLGYLMGLRTVRDSVEDEALGPWISELVYQEIIPTLDLPREELASFAGDVLDRFRNPYIRHQLIDIALNSVSKFKTRVLPSLLEYVEREGRLPERMVLAFAALIRFYRGVDLQGEAIALQDDDEVLHFFQDLWARASGDLSYLVEKVLARADYWGRDLNGVTGLKERLVEPLRVMETGGIFL
jgi:tagaturonate reductase